MNNLNDVWLDADKRYASGEPQDHSVSTDSMSVYFRNLEDRLVEHIGKADAVVGAVAWLTNERILNALSQVKHVSIVVQKEDFLRPDTMGTGDSRWKQKIHSLYKSLPSLLYRYNYPGPIVSGLSTFGCPGIDPVMCVGNHNRDKLPAFPRMHNKFLVFATISDNHSDEYEVDYHSMHPYGVWTGSFNLTHNATMSLENAIYTEEPEVVDAFYREYEQITGLAEELDWETDWMEPKWRLGT